MHRSATDRVTTLQNDRSCSDRAARLPTSFSDEEVVFVVSLLMLAVVALFPVLLLALLLVTNGLEGRVVGTGGRKARSAGRRGTKE